MSKQLPSALCHKMKKGMIYIVITMLVLILIKVIWVCSATRNLGSWEDERLDLLGRSTFLADNLLTSPSKLLSKMPDAIGPQFQGEWALYSCSMYVKALANLSNIYPETKDENIGKMDSIIAIALSPEIRRYDLIRWGEDPLSTLDGENSHISYLSHIAWMIGNYKATSADTKYDELYERICEAMNHRILAAQSLNLPTYPGEAIPVPDMLVAIVALKDYANTHGGKYANTISLWLSRLSSDWIDKESGLLVSFLKEDGTQIENGSIKGSYTALNCYYLALVDYELGKSQYELMKQRFLRDGLLAGIKEYTDRTPIIEEDIDAGIILFGLSPSGTAFAIGPATIYNDQSIRRKFLRTAEIAGHTKGDRNRHYLLANVALVGESITLAMRTTTCHNSHK